MSRGAATAQRHHFPQNWPQLVDNLDKTLTTLKTLKNIENIDKTLAAGRQSWQNVENIDKTLAAGRQSWQNIIFVQYLSIQPI